MSTALGAVADPFVLDGAVRRPRSLGVAELRAGWPVRRAEVVFECARSGPRRHRFEGVLLRQVLLDAEPLFDVGSRKERARCLLAVRGRDGHRAVLSWGELDADFGGVPVLLATALDGLPLDASGAQLVVPTDRCGARYVSAVSQVWTGLWAGPWEDAGTGAGTGTGTDAEEGPGDGLGGRRYSRWR